MNEMENNEYMREIWDILYATRFEIIKGKFRNSVYAETYALNYADAYALYGVEGLRTQILYVQCNLTHWHGKKAKETKLQIIKAAEMLELI
tara:strand:- start:347 stop:619 length:273 start_codon:yes stop_codon:yes gene_type:complete